MSTAIAVYLQGNYSEFAKSLGVFAILVVQGMSIHRFIPNILRQVWPYKFHPVIFQCSSF